jgi:hypothetical protein
VKPLCIALFLVSSLSLGHADVRTAVDCDSRLGTKSANRFFMLGQKEGSKWRKVSEEIFTTESSWNEAAAVWTVGKTVRFVTLTVMSESGDWMKHLAYCFDESGNHRWADAELRSLYGPFCYQQTRNQKGQMTGRFFSRFSREKGREKSIPKPEFADDLSWQTGYFPNYRSALQLPFYRLLTY